MIINSTGYYLNQDIVTFQAGIFDIQECNQMVGLNFPNAITDEKDFYGRKDRLSRIEEIFLSAQRVPVLIIGERRTGKTSLMNVVVRRLETAAIPEHSSRFVYLPIEPRGITSFSTFARSILLRMSSYLWKSWPDLQLESDHSIPEVTTIEQFEVVMMNLLQYSAREIFLVCVDEFDEIVRRIEASELRKVMGLIRTVVEKTDLPLSFFFTMTSVPDLMREEVPSTLIAMAQVLDLRPWDTQEITQLIHDVSGNILDWPPEQMHQLTNLCGGFPYFTKLILYHLVNISSFRKHPVIVTEDLFDETIKQALMDTRTDLVMENLYWCYFSKPEREVLLLLAERKGSLPIRALSQAGAAWVSAARRLVKRYYLREEKDEYVFRASFIGKWLRNWSMYEEELAGIEDLRKHLANRVDIVVDVPAGQVRLLGEPVKLSAQEFAILNILSSYAEQLVRREDLINSVWQTDQGVSDQVIDTAFYRLRRKLHDEGQYIETVPGQGFKLHHVERISGGAPSHSGRKHSGTMRGDSR